MTDWDKGYQDGMSGTAPPSDSIGYAGWVAGQRLREDNEARLRGPAADATPGFDWSVPPVADGGQDTSVPVGPGTAGA
jgi:hypothetical protein